jgi:hypothetical protein
MLELTQIYGSWIALETLLLLALWLRGSGEPVAVPATTGAATLRREGLL